MHRHTKNKTDRRRWEGFSAFLTAARVRMASTEQGRPAGYVCYGVGPPKRIYFLTVSSAFFFWGGGPFSYLCYFMYKDFFTNHIRADQADQPTVRISQSEMSGSEMMDADTWRDATPRPQPTGRNAGFPRTELLHKVLIR